MSLVPGVLAAVGLFSAAASAYPTMISVAAELRVGPVRAAAELGYASAQTVQLATITRNPDGANLVSREH